MKISFNDTQKIFSYIVLLAAALSIFIYYVSPQQPESILIICITLLVIGAGVWFGPVYSLVITLIVLFILGSLILWFQSVQVAIFSAAEGLKTLVIWGAALLLFSFISGRIHDLAGGLGKSVKHLQAEIKSFVAVDRVTGFDNKQRMKLELSEEMKRAERYGNSFVFCCYTCTTLRNLNPYTEKKKQTACLHSSAGKSDQVCGKRIKNSVPLRNGSVLCSRIRRQNTCRPF